MVKRLTGGQNESVQFDDGKYRYRPGPARNCATLPPFVTCSHPEPYHPTPNRPVNHEPSRTEANRYRPSLTAANPTADREPQPPPVNPQGNPPPRQPLAGRPPVQPAFRPLIPRPTRYAVRPAACRSTTERTGYAPPPTPPRKAYPRPSAAPVNRCGSQ